MRLRAWGLVANLVFNIVALYGLASLLGAGSGGALWLTIGTIGTIACLLVLAQPARDSDTTADDSQHGEHRP